MSITQTIKEKSSGVLKIFAWIFRAIFAVAGAALAIYTAWIFLKRDVKELKQDVPVINARTWQNKRDLRDLKQRHDYDIKIVEDSYKRIEEHMKEQRKWNGKVDTRQQQMQIDLKVIQKEMEK